jgi:serine/threonine-protein kinase
VSVKDDAERDAIATGETVFATADGTPTLGAPRSTAPSSDLAAQLIAGRYRITSLLGEGGMGFVYRARDTVLDEDVALKVLRHDLMATPELVERFKREVKLARRVTHPNVARMFDIGDHGGSSFLTMEFIDGEPLNDLLHKAGRLPDARVIALVADICAGLAAAHKAGVVHRDLKPDNVMLSRDGRVLITDFGIARDPVSAPHGTLGAILGTPAYMAPEQVEARPDIDFRADIYALGVMLFELFTGELPWKGTSPFTIAVARLHAPPPDPRNVRGGLSPELASVIARCLARKPDERFSDALEVARELSAMSPTLPEGSLAVFASAPEAVPAEDKTVAVLPFRNLGTPDDEYMAEGVTEDLIDALSMTPGLRVRPRSAVARFRSQEADPREVGRELGVQVVVEGSVRRAGDTVRSSVRLLSVEDGFQLWAQRFDRPANDILVVSDETARAIADALTVHGKGRGRVAPSDPVVVELFLRAKVELRKVWPDNTLRAVELLESAHARAPDDAAVIALYARACARLWFYGGRVGAQAEGRARELAERAVAAAPNEADSMLAMASVHLMLNESRETARIARSALDRAPDNPDVRELFARLQLEAGQIEQALETLDSLLILDPMMRNSRLDQIRGNGLLGNYQRALAMVQEDVNVTESVQSSSVLRARLGLWSDEIGATLGNIQIPEDAPLASAWSIARFAIGLRSGTIEGQHMLMAETVLVELGTSPRFRTMFAQLLTEFNLFAGREEDGLRHLRMAVDEGLFDIGWMDRCPLLARLHSHGEYQAARRIVAERARAILTELRLQAS